MGNIKGIYAAITFVALLTPTIVAAQARGRVTGVGGVFVTSKDPNRLRKFGFPKRLRYDSLSRLI